MKKRPPLERIDGIKIFLQKHTLELAEVMFAYVDSDRDRLKKFLPWVDAVNSTEDEIAYIKSSMKNWKKCTMFDYGIFNKDGDEYMGNLGVHSIAWEHDRCELGYWILGKFEGKGYVLEAVTLLEKQLFAMGFHRLEIRCSFLNQRSANIPKARGYVLEGTLRQDTREKQAYSDTLVFAKLSSEREANRDSSW
ncbi:MAG: GNAT family N-acetyltransferase [Oligoflexia bacterium]|nr:GNAT family N-acetyltransferase [Oligoflexia bacterium]MBF0364907.1 GNAT family N-acetyltransferase [Oligoflexia bacterium]